MHRIRCDPIWNELELQGVNIETVFVEEPVVGRMIVKV